VYFSIISLILFARSRANAAGFSSPARVGCRFSSGANPIFRDGAVSQSAKSPLGSIPLSGIVRQHNVLICLAANTSAGVTNKINAHQNIPARVTQPNAGPHAIAESAESGQMTGRGG
jgi:hypothetical protein